VKFRPQGDRGLAPSRVSGFGPRGGYEAYTAGANRDTRVVVHIETEAGADAAAEIAAVDGVDVLFFGALDLSHDMGVPGQTTHVRVAEARARVAAAATAAGKLFGAVAPDREGADALAASGAGYLLTTVEAVLAAGVSDLLGDRSA
jgi:4-hydroxy-2-oxoheptanedioate aldolase